MLSIIIPAYNAEQFIGNLLSLLASQISDGVEIIVVNDGSVDSTEKIVSDFAVECNFVKLLNQENKGESGARNSGLEAVSGEYVCFLDCDDSYMPDSVSHITGFVDANPGKDIYCFSYKSVDGTKEVIYSAPNLDNKEFETVDFLKEFLLKKLPCHICSVVFRRSFLIENNLWFTQDLKIGADIDFLLRSFCFIRNAVYSDRVCYIYQIRQDSIMQGYHSYSLHQYHSFENRRDILLTPYYQTAELSKYSRFWIQNQLLSNIVYYLKSNIKDSVITQALIKDCKLLRKYTPFGKLKNYIAIIIAKILPIKIILRVLKSDIRKV